MKRLQLTLMLCAGLALSFCTAPVLAADRDAAETVGGFAMKLSEALGTRSSGPLAAASRLEAAGVTLRADFSVTLTHGEAARILTGLGIKVATPVDPAAKISIGKSMQLAASAGLRVATGSGLTSTDLPIQCLLERNHGQCVNCCKDALASHPDGANGSDGRICSRFCKTPPPPPSDPEPQP